MDADFNGKLIGTPFDKHNLPIRLSHFYNQGGKGDKKLVYRTDIITQYPEYPIFKGEKYVSLGYKYELIEQDYPMLSLNEVLVNVEYRPDGSSMNMFRQYMKNPQGFAFIRKSSMQLAPTAKRRFMEAIHYVSSSLILKNKRFLQESPKKLLTLCAVPFGIALYLFIRYKTKNIQ